MADRDAPTADDAPTEADAAAPDASGGPVDSVYVAGYVSDADGAVIDRVLAGSDVIEDDTIVWLESTPDDQVTMDAMIDQIGPDAIDWDSEPQLYAGPPQTMQASLAGEESLTAADRVLDDVEERLRRAEGLAAGLIMDAVDDEDLPETLEPSTAAKVAAAMSDAGDEVEADGDDPEEVAANEHAVDRAEELAARLDQLEEVLSELLDATTHDEELGPDDEGVVVDERPTSA